MNNIAATENENIVEAQGLRKKFGANIVLKGIDFSIPTGRIYGLVGHNGAGKTTAINALLGLTNYEGKVRVLGREPFANRAELMADIAFISDVASLPRFLKVSELLDLMGDTHPNFNFEKARELLLDTDISLRSKIKSLSKGMLAQLHLAIVMAIDAKLLVLDEPTLGLDITFRKKFYQRLVEDYMSENRSVLITTHQVDEIEFLLTDLIFLRNGEIVLDSTMENIARRFSQVFIDPNKLEQARQQKPIYTRVQLGQTIMIFDGVEQEIAQNLGTLSTASVSDLFVALMERPSGAMENSK